MNANGSKKKSISSILAVLLVFVFVFVLLAAINQEVNPDETGLGAREWIVSKTPDLGKPFVSDFLIEGKSGEYIGKSISWTTGTLGFNRGFFDFIPDFILGVLAGFWVCSMYWFAFGENKLTSSLLNRFGVKQKNLRSSWLAFIGDSFWKLLVFGAVYGVLMQIPLLNRFLLIITFDVLGVSFFVRSILIALYVGFLPGAIEAYTRYKIRKKYYERIIAAKYEGQALRTLIGGKR